MSCPRHTTARDCAECEGKGRVVPMIGIIEDDERDCPYCDGSGEMSPEREAELRDEDAADRWIDRCDGIGVLP